MNKGYLNQNMKKLLTTMSLAAFSALASLAIAQQGPDAQADPSAFAQPAPEAEANSSLRLEARLQPVIPVDASGQARLDAEVGTANDRFTAVVENRNSHFPALGIHPAHGFR